MGPTTDAMGDEMDDWEPDAARAGFDATRLERITAHLERRYLEPGKIAGCQLADRPRTGSSPTGGRSATRTGSATSRWRDDTIFRIYSMTKPITSVALMTLFEQGHFKLDDPISRFVPSWKQHQVWVDGDGSEMQYEPAAPPDLVP